MIFQEQDGQTIMLDSSSLLVNGVAYELPKRLQNRNGHSLAQVNNRIFIDGYEFQNGKFKRTLAALFHMLF
jgi:hypothetical protein